MPNNLTNRYETRLDFELYLGDYWDLYLDEQPTLPYTQDNIISGDTLITYFDFDDTDIYSGTGSTSADTIFSLDEWNGAINKGVTNNTIGLVGLDNGLITYDKSSGSTALLSALTGTNITIKSGDTRFFMNRVSGNTGDYVYPISIESGGTVGRYAKLCGGYYQGFFALEGYDYQTLPTRYKNGWTAEFWLRKNDSNCSGQTATTLNDTYPNNKGFFFYMGTRAENKFWNIFEGLHSGACSGVTGDTLCTDVKETDIQLTKHVPLSPPRVNVRTVKNQFLWYHRANEGFFHSTCDDPAGDDRIPGGLASEFTGDSITIAEKDTKVTNDTNPFLLYHRANEGFFHTGCDDPSGDDKIPGGLASEFSGVTAPKKETDKNADIVDNAIGFRIKDGGSLSYRRLTSERVNTGDTCYTAVTVEEGVTEEKPIEEDKWSHIVVKFDPYQNYTHECSPDYKSERKGKLSVYVNSKLKLVIRDFNEPYTKGLNDHYLKQVGVPYNLSIGGGTQGLIESQTFDGPDPKDKGLFIEKNFAGTFIGDISKFRLYNTSLNWCQIQNNFDKERQIYGIEATINCR